jgi:hypothetical protein
MFDDAGGCLTQNRINVRLVQNNVYFNKPIWGSMDRSPDPVDYGRKPTGGASPTASDHTSTKAGNTVAVFSLSGRKDMLL